MKKRILVIDDTASVRDVFYEYLKRDYSVRVAHPSDLDWRDLYKIDLLITDTEMGFGIINGVRVTELSKKANPKIPVILMSGGEEPIGHKADRFFTKPPDWDLLTQTIAELLGE